MLEDKDRRVPSWKSLLGEGGILLAWIIAAGVAVRLLVAPYTSGSDIPQFAGFADTFLRHGLKFYLYCSSRSARAEGWAYPWPYVYGPLFILMLGALRLAAPGRVFHGVMGGEYVVYAPRDWVYALKMLYVAGDAASAVLIYLIARANGVGKRRALLGSALYMFNPMVFYVSSVYGMLDPVMLAFILGGLLLLHKREWETWGLVLLGLALAVKPTAVYAFIPLVFYYARRGFWSAAKTFAVPVVVAAALYAPFLASAPGSLSVYIEAVKSVSCPCYSVPVPYSFNGLSSIAFYAWNHAGVNTSYILRLWPLLMAPFLLLVLVSSTRARSPVTAAGLGYIVYTLAYWRVNYQYLVPSIGFAVLLFLAGRGCPRVKASSLAFQFLAGLWPLMYPMSFWAWVHMPAPNPTVIRVLDSFSLMVFDDLAYVYYSLLLTLSEAVLVVEASLCALREEL